MHSVAAHNDSPSWPEAIVFLGILFTVILVIGIAVAAYTDLHKTKIQSDQEEALRRLIGRYEQLAENTVDGQQRLITDLSDVRSRTAAIEQILRTVE